MQVSPIEEQCQIIQEQFQVGICILVSFKFPVWQ